MRKKGIIQVGRNCFLEQLQPLNHSGKGWIQRKKGSTIGFYKKITSFNTSFKSF